MNDDSQLDTLLRHDGSPPLPDDGFSDRVLAALPPAEPKRSWWGWRTYVIAAVSAAWVVIWGPRLGGGSALRVTTGLVSALDSVVMCLVQPPVLIALGCTALAFALSSPDDRRI